MNSFRSTIETIHDTSKLFDDDHNCTAIDKTTGELCGESESLKIIDQFQKLYETRMEHVDKELENKFDQVCMKFEISKEWIRNLREQNIMLVQVVEELEQAACSRVKLLEQKLKQSSILVSDNMPNAIHTEQTINLLSSRVNGLEKDEKCMQQKIEFLQSDIRGLLELIRRAVQEKHWSLENITFFEIQPSDIPVPSNCTCGEQENINCKEMQFLKQQIKGLKENEQKMITYQRELENKLTHPNLKLQNKEDILKRHISQYQNFSDNIRKHSKFTDGHECNLLAANNEETFDIMLVADIVEKLFVEKDLETESLERRLQEVESNLAIVSRDSNRNLSNLKTQLNEKCKAIKEVEQRLANLRKESIAQQDDLTAQVVGKDEIITSLQKEMTMLHEQCSNANMQIHFKEEIIKEMRKELKQAVGKELHGIQNVCTDIKSCQEAVVKLGNPTNEQNQILAYLNKLKLLMEQEKEELSKLKVDLEKTIENLCCEKYKECHMVNNECDEDNVRCKLAQSISYINEMYSRKEEFLTIINSLQNKDINQQFKLMDIFKACAVEAQVTIEDIKDEVNVIVSSFKCRHQKYADLNKEVTNVQNQLTKSRGEITKAINNLQLQEEERKRQNERIISRKNKLKDIKNDINQAQCRLSTYITELQKCAQENVLSGYTEMCISNDLLSSVIDEIEKASCSLQSFQTQGCCVMTDLEILKMEFFEVDSSVKKLQGKMDEALPEHNTIETVLLEKEQKLKKLENEVDVIHTKIQNIIDILFSSKETVHDCNTEVQLYIQTLNEILQVKKDVYKLRKKHDEQKYKMSQGTLYTECDKNTCLWKSKLTDLQDQVKILQHEAQCSQETNNFLRNNLETVEEELRVVQAKADNFRRSNFRENMELRKKIIELENTLKYQHEVECTLRRQLSDSELEMKKSKELLNCYNVEHSLEESFVHCSCNQYRHDTMTVPQVFKTLQNTIKSTKSGLQELKAEFKKLVCENATNFCSSASTFVNLIDKLEKYANELDNCFQEIEELKNALYSKKKLIENMDEIIQIQKNSIALTQTELKELHQKLQEKIDNQNQTICQYQKENAELLRQNELQVQTIGHLQNAVVEAKRCIDQMGQRTEYDRIAMNLQLEEKSRAIRLLEIFVDETESQYHECFIEAAKQDKMLELQRDAIDKLQQKLSFMEYDNHLTIIIVHITYYSLLNTIQEQLEAHIADIQALKCKVDDLAQSKCYMENKYLNTKKLLQEAECKLQNLRKEMLKNDDGVIVHRDKECQCKIEMKDCATQDIIDPFTSLTCNTDLCRDLSCDEDFQSEMIVLINENRDLKRQLQKFRLDFDIIDKELKMEKESETCTQQISFELQKLRDTACCLQYENEQLQSDLIVQTQKTEDLMERLQFIDENDKKLEKLLKKLDDKQIQLNRLTNQVANNEIIMKKQTEVIEDLEKKLDVRNRQTKGYLAELDDAEEEMSGLHERIKSLKTMLKEKSDDMAKLQADYEVLKNDNSILRMENNTFEDRTKEDICRMQKMLKEVQRQLCFSENNYCRVTEDYNKTQEQLIKMSKREADLQECLTNMEREYCLKLANMEKEKIKLGDCLEKLREELEDVQQCYSSKCGEHCKLQDVCKSYAEQSELLQQQLEHEREKVTNMEESNRCIMQQLEEYMQQNCALIKEKSIVEQTNCEIISELQETHKSLLELKRECQLKNKSLACISAELTETALSRSELCNQSQYVVSCIRIWMEEQREYVNKLASKLKAQQQELLHLEFEKKSLLDETKKLRRINHSLMQRIRRIHRHGGKNVRSACVACQVLPQNIDIRNSMNSKHSTSQKKLHLMKAAKRMSVCGNGWWYPRMRYLVNELRKRNIEYNQACFDRANSEMGLEENHDCGYQSSTSK